MFKKTNKRKKRTNKKKRTYKRKSTYKKKGGGKTPYSRRREPCRYGESCRRTNPQHFIDFTHPATRDKDIKIFIKDAYDSYTKGNDVFAHLEHGSIQFLKEGIDTNVQLSFFFHLLTYIVCNICPLVEAYGQAFLSTMLQRFNEESVDISVNKKDVDDKVQACMEHLGIDHINCIAILSALTNPESEFNQKGCVA